MLKPIRKILLAGVLGLATVYLANSAQAQAPPQCLYYWYECNNQAGALQIEGPCPWGPPEMGYLYYQCMGNEGGMLYDGCCQW